MTFMIKFAILVAIIATSYYYVYTTRNQRKSVAKGYTAKGWESVRDIFRKHVDDGWQEGGALSVYHKGQLVVDLYGGYADTYIELEWDKDTLSQYYSSTKGLGAIVMAVLVDRGLLDYTKPVSHYWPEFGQNGKEHITVEQLIGHQAGLAAIDESFDFLDIINDDQKISKILASQKPLWTPGTGIGYHAGTLGLYEDQLVKRIDPKKRSLGQFFQEEIAKPFGLDVFIGLPKEENYRCARVVDSQFHSFSDVKTYVMYKYVKGKWYSNTDGIMHKVITNPANIIDITTNYNKPSWREVATASTNGFGTATALGKIYGILANGGRDESKKTLLNEKILKLLREPLMNGTCKAMGIPLTFGRGVSVWKSPTGSDVFGTFGAGGQVGKCDASNHLGIGYITSHATLDRGLDMKYVELEEAIYTVIRQL